MSTNPISIFNQLEINKLRLNETTSDVVSQLSATMTKIYASFRSSLHYLTKKDLNIPNNVNEGRLLTQPDIIRNLDGLDNIEVFHMCMFPRLDHISSLKKRLKEDCQKPILVFPYLIVGTFRNHIVFFALNKKTKEIVFYDPRGFTIADYQNDKLYRFGNTLIETFTEMNFFQNKEKEQCDSFNCGIYVIYRLLLLNKYPDQRIECLIRQYPLSYNRAIELRDTSQNGVLRY